MTLDGDTAQAILADVGIGTTIGQSKVKYGPAERAFRKAVEREFEAYREQNPKAVLDIPSELPPPELDVSKYMQPPKGGGGRTAGASPR